MKTASSIAFAICLSVAQLAQANDPCPTAELAPLGIAPVPDKCAPASCLVDFAGYQWWTSYQYYGDGSYFPGGGYFYNAGEGTAFSPMNVFVDSEGMHLRIAQQDLGAGPVPAGAEAVLMFKANGAEANLGYGDYLATIKILTAPSWAQLDPNAVVGVFTYERLRDGSTGTGINPNREIDETEISYWGWNGTAPCPFTGSVAAECFGNAQFTLQPFNDDPDNLHRYTIAAGVQTITVVMRWRGANQPVSFYEYNGAFTLGNLPVKADNHWKTSTEQDQFVPATGCQRFHVNFWNGNYIAGLTPHPPPSTLPQEIVVTDFAYKAFRGGAGSQ